MKLILPAKLVAIALLMASFSVVADVCSDKAGFEISVLTFESECPRKTTIDVNGEACIIERKPRAGQSEFICGQVEGLWVGGPYIYTGGKSVVLNELPELSEDIPVSEFTATNYGDNAAAESRQANTNVVRGFTDTRQSLSNMNSNLSKIYAGIGQLFSDVRESRNAAFEAKISSLNNLQSTLNAESAALSAAAQANEARDVVVSQSNLMRDMIFRGFNDNAELHAITHNYVQDIPSIAIGVENGRYHAQVAANRAENAEISAREAMQAANEAEQASYEVYDLALETREYIREVYNNSYDNIETLASIQSATSQLYGLRDQIRSDTRGSAQDAAFSTQNTVWQSNDQIMTYMGSLNQSQSAALSDIKNAIENGSSGGTDDDSETNQKLDVLGEKLDGIQTTLDGFSDTTGMASELSNAISDTNSQLSSEMDAMYQGFATEEKLTQLDTTVSAMVANSGLSNYDTVDKVRNSLATATTISEIFEISRSGCSPYDFWQQQINFCPAAEKSSMVLEYFIWALTAIFAFLHITGFLTKLRTE